jgi:SAM-dependent methyltransferase
MPKDMAVKTNFYRKKSSQMEKEMPWQIKMFQKTLKKKLRLKALRKHIGSLGENELCLLVTCGDNNGAMNYYLRAIGGCWSWADYEAKSILEMSELLGDEVLHVKDDSLPFPSDHFDYVVSIDVHEHLPDMNPFTKELWRVAQKGAKVIVTVPNGDETKLATRIKNFIGMTKEKYGHVREGLDLPELNELLENNGIAPVGNSTFSKFFTEMLELAINFLYVNILSKKSPSKVRQGTIAPATEDQLKSIEKTYRIYSLVYPFFRTISALDALFWYTRGYVVMIEGRKE